MERIPRRSSGTRFGCEVFVPYNMIMTGIGYLIGTVGGTDKGDRWSCTMPTETAREFGFGGRDRRDVGHHQEIPFTAPVEVIGPQKYYLSVTMNGTTARLRTVPTAVGAAQTLTAKSAAGTFGTVGDLTAPTTFTADKGADCVHLLTFEAKRSDSMVKVKAKETLSTGCSGVSRAKCSMSTT